MVWVCPEPEEGMTEQRQSMDQKQKVEDSAKRSTALQTPLGLLGSRQKPKDEIESEQYVG